MGSDDRSFRQILLIRDDDINLRCHAKTLGNGVDHLEGPVG